MAARSSRIEGVVSNLNLVLSVFKWTADASAVDAGNTAGASVLMYL